MKLFLLALLLSQEVGAGDLEAAVKHFYVDLEAASIRGSIVDNDDVDRCREVLTSSYQAAIATARKDLQSWIEIIIREPEEFGYLKLPFTEGSVFTGVYEGGHYIGIEEVEEAGDRGYAKVHLRLELPETKYGLGRPGRAAPRRWTVVNR